MVGCFCEHLINHPKEQSHLLHVPLLSQNFRQDWQELPGFLITIMWSNAPSGSSAQQMTKSKCGCLAARLFFPTSAMDLVASAGTAPAWKMNGACSGRLNAALRIIMFEREGVKTSFGRTDLGTKHTLGNVEGH